MVKKHMPESPDILVIKNDKRGMQSLLSELKPSPSIRAAKSLLEQTKPILICTGFPVNGKPETDGPAGAVILAQALKNLGKKSLILSWHRVIEALQSQLADIDYAILPQGAPIAKQINGAAVTIEICGRVKDNSYRNFKGIDIQNEVPWFEDAIGNHALISIGDGGNEFGMGSAPLNWFKTWAVEPPVSTCDILVASQVSNWGALAVVAALAKQTQTDLLPKPIAYQKLLQELASQGLVDGISGMSKPFEDGYSIEIGCAVLQELRNWAQR